MEEKINFLGCHYAKDIEGQESTYYPNVDSRHIFLRKDYNLYTTTIQVDQDEFKLNCKWKPKHHMMFDFGVVHIEKKNGARTCQLQC